MFREVQIIAPVGSQFGLISKENDPVVVILCRRKGEEWPHGFEPRGGLNEIIEGCDRYIVEKC